MVTQTTCPNQPDVTHVTLAVATRASQATQMINVGNNVGLLWTQPYGDGGADLETAIIDPSGNTLVGPNRVTPLDGVFNFNGRVARGDGGFIVVYEEGGAPPQFAFLNQNLELIPGSARPFPGAVGVGRLPDVDWDPINQQWGLYWQDSADAPMFARMTASGAPLGTAVQLAAQASWSGTRAVSNNLQWTGSEHAVLHGTAEPDGGRALTLSLISPSGNVTASNPIAVGPYGISNQTFGWNGSEFAIMWSQTDWPAMSVHFVRATPDGAPIPGTLRTISNASTPRADFPTLTWNGSEWVLAWGETADGFSWELWTIRMLPSTRRQLACTAATPRFPALLSLGPGTLLTHRNGSTTRIDGPTELITLP